MGLFGDLFDFDGDGELDAFELMGEFFLFDALTRLPDAESDEDAESDLEEDEDTESDLEEDET